LRVLVVNQPELAEAIDRLRGEWNERSGGQLTVSDDRLSWTGMDAPKNLDADVILFPSRHLGELASRGWLRPVRPNVLASVELHTSDFFPVVREELIRWGGETMALPLGLDPDGECMGPSGPLFPSLLKSLDSNAISAERLDVFFDSKTMRPRIAEKPFVDALTEIVVPQSDRSRNQSVGRRELRVLGYSDQLIAVTRSSRNAATAFKLLEWLALPDTSLQINSATGGMLPVRRSMMSQAGWYRANWTADERAQAARTLEQVVSSGNYLMVPRIPGIDEYLEVLEEGMIAAMEGNDSPKAALEKVSQRWEAITDARGRDAQREAYLEHLGLDEP
jgi:hypothetical protein